jgi:cytochrome c peroxidase
MIQKSGQNLFILCITVLMLSISCSDEVTSGNDEGKDLTNIPYAPQPYILNYPDDYPEMVIPTDNPTTMDGANLGRHLFFDPILSADSTMSCINCHLPEASFTDNKAVSPGIDGISGRFSSMSLFNVGFYDTGLFWNGRSPNLEMQALQPIEDPLELHDTWENVERKLRGTERYHELFRKAFGIEKTTEITRDLATKALAQFQRTIVASGQSKYDLWKAGDYFFTDLEFFGYQMFFDVNDDFKQVECNHCHADPLLTSNDYLNNGLQEAETFDDFENLGLGEVTGRRVDNGLFRVPTLYNVMLTAPYMHDGRLATIDDVLDHYDSGGKNSPSADALLRPLEMTNLERRALKAFLHTLTDTAYLSNPMLQDPFKE